WPAPGPVLQGLATSRLARLLEPRSPPPAFSGCRPTVASGAWHCRALLDSVKSSFQVTRGSRRTAARAACSRPKAPTTTRTAAPLVTEEQKAVFRRALRRAREAAGQSQSGLSQTIGVSRSAVWQWEEGRATPTADNFAALQGE